ncbi:FGGY-family carbohydrate kinase [Dactylosporangium cerinum]|uniref:FGGY-family carbohydrate kinase n=1 Tax=Dactylosporangium cerinum TaxID=1434730 RepID=A0ABV9WHB4_9ACTN
MTTPAIVALDCSTSACKAVVFDLAGETVCESRCHLTTSSPRPGWYEQNATDWWEAAADALTSVAKLLPRNVQLVALGITHQRETFVCVDRRWRPIRPAILWLDDRAEEQVARLGGTDLHAATGKPPSTVPSFYKLAWLAEHEPETLRGTHQVLDVHAALAHYLTGAAVTPWASADSTGLLDLSTRTWSLPLLAACGLTLEQMPRLCAPGDTVGGLRPDVARRTGLPVGLPIVAGAGDGQCAGLGVGALEPGTAYLNLGTSFSLGAFVPGHPILPGLRTVVTGVPDTSAVETLLPCGGMTLTWLWSNVLASDDPAVSSAAVEVPAGANGLLFLPYLEGRETPGHEPDVRAAFLGMSVRHGQPEMVRAVIEGLAYDQRDCLEHLNRQLGRDIERIVVTGGHAHSALVSQIFANVLGVPVAVAPERESTALGAAIIAAAGRSGSVREAARTMTRPAVALPVDIDAAKYYDAAHQLRTKVLAHFAAGTAALTAMRRMS